MNTHACEKTLVTRLWPSYDPIYLRPGFSYLIAILAAVLLTSFLIIDSPHRTTESPVLYLSSVRNDDIPHLAIPVDKPLVVSYSVGSFRLDHEVTLTLIHIDQIVYRNEGLEHLDELGIGTIVLSPDLLESGPYRLELVVTDPSEVPRPDTLSYRFTLSIQTDNPHNSR